MNEVLIVGEVKDGSLDLRSVELLGAGKKLASDLGGEFSVVVMGEDVSGPAEEAARYGPARVYKVEDSLLKGFKPDLWVKALEQVCGEIEPEIVLMSHSHMGMEVGPRLAYRLSSPLVTDCIDLSIDPEDRLLLRTKPIYGGNAISVFKFPGRPQLATVRGKIFEPAEVADRKGEVIDMGVRIDESMLKVESLEVVEEDIVALDKADVVVAGGAGLGEEEGFRMLEELAEVLKKLYGGSVMIGCSRVAVDKGWISSDHQVGLTGTIISPDIYVAVGISGAIQHLVGMVHSKKIIAINTDPGCNMFKVADYGVVEDYKKVIPGVIKRLEGIS